MLYDYTPVKNYSGCFTIPPGNRGFWNYNMWIIHTYKDKMTDASNLINENKVNFRMAIKWRNIDVLI